MIAKKPSFDYAVCMACGLCKSACPISCINLSNTSIDAYKKAYPVLFSKVECTGCGICQKICPVDAITLV